MRSLFYRQYIKENYLVKKMVSIINKVKTKTKGTKVKKPQRKSLLNRLIAKVKSVKFPKSLKKSTSTDTIRFNVYNDMEKLTKKLAGHTTCIDDKKLIDAILLQHRIGSESINGEVEKACYPILCNHQKECKCKNNAVTLALKKVPLFDTPLIKPGERITSSRWTQFDVYAEIVCLKLCTYLVRSSVCPNLPMFFAYFPCGTCSFENIEITKHFESSANGKGPCVLVLNEFASGGDFKHWVLTPRSFDEWMNAYFQIFMGLAAIQKYFGIAHFDLHWGNVLVHNVPKGGFWKYTLNGKDYYCPNLGFVFVLWDFGYSYIPGKLEITGALRTRHVREAIATGTEYTYDYTQISDAPHWLKKRDVEVPEKMMTEFGLFVGQNWPLHIVIKLLYAGKDSYFDLSKRPAASSPNSILQDYNLDKRPSQIDIPEEYKKYINSNFDNWGKEKSPLSSFGSSKTIKEKSKSTSKTAVKSVSVKSKTKSKTKSSSTRPPSKSKSSTRK